MTVRRLRPGPAAVLATAIVAVVVLASGSRAVTGSDPITTVAGTGTEGFSGDGGPATSAQLRVPWGVAVDAAGNLYIAERGNDRVRKVTPGGTITTVAGTGAYGFSGDGGPATMAQLDAPYGVTVDAAGNVYIADMGNHRVRRVAPAPVAVFAAAPVSGQAPLTVSVDGSGSTAAGGTIVSFGWDFGDGARASGPQATHTYAAAGTYTVTLTVTDENGSTDQATRTVTGSAPVGEAAGGAQPEQVAPSGACTVRGTPGRDVLRGTARRDVICGLGGNDVLRGGRGNDVLRGGRGADQLRGGKGADVIQAGRGKDRLFGGAGADGLRGAAGRDTLVGGRGRDTLVGGRGRDVARGGPGKDACRAERRRSC